MKKIPFTRGEFAAAVFDVKGFPVLSLPEIAIVGRSNVGKSTLINHLLNAKLAKTSSIPGKTQSINFYKVDEQIALVDLPGYGYAKVSKPVKDHWAGLIDNYLEERKELKLILFLIDSRRDLTDEDRAFAEWAAFHKKQVLFIFTKSDKISAGEIQKRLQAASEELNSAIFLSYSIKHPHARMDLIKSINGILYTE